MASPDSPAKGAAFPIGDWTARISLTPTGSVTVDYVDPAGKPCRRIKRDAAFQRAHKAELDALKARVADIEGALREARGRLEQTFRNGRDWSVEDWCQRYRDHPLTRTMAERLLWQFTPGDRAAFTALGTAPALTGIDGAAIAPPSGPCRVRLWHPVMADAQTRQAWRARLLEIGLRQPLWQLWRPVYELTDPERLTATYSNRFAGLLLNQPVFVRILRNRGWVLKSRMLGAPADEVKPARLALPAFGLIAEYWGRGAGDVQDEHDYGAPNFQHFATSQIRFYRAREDSTAGARPVPLTEVAALAFCEAMFDLELVTGVTALGFDGRWRDPGRDATPPPADEHPVGVTWNGDLTQRTPGELGKMRTELLQWLVPRLAIADRLRLDGHMLHVKGKWNDYAIHTGNAAVRIVGPNSHVCIVPGGRTDEVGQVPLPFAGDEVLALVLSKAHMLADEDRIRDRDIVRQLGRG
jgi:Domain of unknown function (DUF4132)